MLTEDTRTRHPTPPHPTPACTHAVEQLREADANLLCARCHVSLRMCVFVCTRVACVCVCVCVCGCVCFRARATAALQVLSFWPSGCIIEHISKCIMYAHPHPRLLCGPVVLVAWQRGVGKDACAIQEPREYCPG